MDVSAREALEVKRRPKGAQLYVTQLAGKAVANRVVALLRCCVSRFCSAALYANILEMIRLRSLVYPFTLIGRGEVV